MPEEDLRSAASIIEECITSSPKSDRKPWQTQELKGDDKEIRKIINAFIRNLKKDAMREQDAAYRRSAEAHLEIEKAITDSPEVEIEEGEEVVLL